MSALTKPIGASTLVQAGQPCGDSNIPDGYVCRLGGGGKAKSAWPVGQAAKSEKSAKADAASERANKANTGAAHHEAASEHKLAGTFHDRASRATKDSRESQAHADKAQEHFGKMKEHHDASDKAYRGGGGEHLPTENEAEGFFANSAADVADRQKAWQGAFKDAGKYMTALGGDKVDTRNFLDSSHGRKIGEHVKEGKTVEQAMLSYFGSPGGIAKAMRDIRKNRSKF
mgnify:CR=1 FL=1